MTYFSNFKKCLFIIDKKVTNLVPYILVSLILAGVDILGLGLVFPYINYIIDPQSSVSQNTKFFFENNLPFFQSYNLIIVLSFLVLIAFILKNILNFFLTAIIYKFATREISILRPRLMFIYQKIWHFI